MKLEEILKKVEQIKKSDKKDELINELETGLKSFSETYKADLKTKDETLSDLSMMKERITNLKKAFNIDESVSYKETLSEIAKKKEEFENQISELGSSTDEKTKSYVAIQRKLEELEKKHIKLSTDLEIKEQTLAEEKFNSNLKDSFSKVGNPLYIPNVLHELTDRVKKNPTKSLDELCKEYISEKPLFGSKEAIAGSGGTPPPPNENINKKYSMLDVMNQVSQK